MRGSLFFAVFLAAGIALGQESSPPSGMSARDIFWSASDLVSGGVTPNPGTTGAKAAKPSSPKPKKTTTSATTTSVKHIDPQTVVANGYGAQPHLVSLTSDRIGLRYTLLQRDPSGKYVEVLPSTVFHSGDHVKISIMANHAGYLYIIQQGSSGTWSPIFPSQDAAQGSNYVESGQVYEIPNDGAFELNKQAGKEHLFIMLSVNPINDLDGAIFGLKDQKTAPTQPAQPSASETLEASNQITDTLVQQLQSRDLVPVREQVNTAANDDTQQSEKAVYVVNSLSAESHGSRVVAPLVLDHE
ncbi:DUF4384 domain-containing protein [Alloacidobacterium dinghuense]|uniref:DUF4384 domain-containing protein n=1 Tax=Alloacidobacterium dinghuense TaxID=2763107 RepID=A0A7G8BJX8_9BACT|nr:DUF4384 domain-containing protein [Alloacidobacterium dinghuense]QNI32848.1 DUF4384 domain-containing protein [Alloacidobacterium dinghuense]